MNKKLEFKPSVVYTLENENIYQTRVVINPLTTLFETVKEFVPMQSAHQLLAGKKNALNSLNNSVKEMEKAVIDLDAIIKKAEKITTEKHSKSAAVRTAK